MCEPELETKYQSLAHGTTVLESSLHTNLTEHINSEVGLGTITNVNSAKEWLRNSFLYQRIQQNPKHYSIGKDGNQTWQERIDEMVSESIGRLKENQLVESSDSDHNSLVSTEFGDIMSKVTFPAKIIILAFINALAVLYSAIDSTLIFQGMLQRTKLIQMSIILKLPERATLRDMVSPVLSLFCVS